MQLSDIVSANPNLSFYLHLNTLILLAGATHTYLHFYTNKFMSLNLFYAFGSRLKEALSALSIDKHYLNVHLRESWWLHILYVNP